MLFVALHQLQLAVLHLDGNVLVACSPYGLAGGILAGFDHTVENRKCAMQPQNQLRYVGLDNPELHPEEDDAEQTKKMTQPLVH